MDDFLNRFKRLAGILERFEQDKCARSLIYVSQNITELKIVFLCR